MKRILILPLFLSLLSGCLEKKNRAFFTDDGITLGEPKVVEGGGLFIPIDFKTRIIHSAQWLYDVEWKQKDNKITIMALFSVPPDMKKSVYQGGHHLEGRETVFLRCLPHPLSRSRRQNPLRRGGQDPPAGVWELG